MGHYYSGMLDIYTDLTLQYKYFGGHIELLEVEELAALRKQVSEAEVNDCIARFNDVFEMQPDCDPAEIRKAAVTAVALDKLVAAHRLGSWPIIIKERETPGTKLLLPLLYWVILCSLQGVFL